MKMAIPGSGDVGQVLGAGFAGLGHQVRMGTRESQKDKVQASVKMTGRGVSADTFAGAAAFGELAVVATLWQGTESALRLADSENLAGKVVVDATNPLDFSGGMLPKLAVTPAGSSGEQVQRWLPQARVVKAFNTVGNPPMIKPQFPGGPPDMFICGNDAGAKQTVIALLKECGWPAVDLGGIECTRYLEALALIWILHFLRTSTGIHAFKLLQK